MHIGANSNVQDLATIGARPTFVYGKLDPAAFAEVPERSGEFAVYIGDEVSIGSQAQVFGPAFVGNGTYIGMQALIVNATVGAGVVIEPGAIVMSVSVPDGRYVPAGEVVTTQHAADALPAITEKYAFRRLGADTVDLYLALAVSLGATAEVAQESESPSSSTSSGDGHSATGAAPAGEGSAATPEEAHASSAAHD
jgi:carbonic anhydrase/acetyltransferase-like protein (isoleucine patch superfamily)